MEKEKPRLRDDQVPKSSTPPPSKETSSEWNQLTIPGTEKSEKLIRVESIPLTESSPSKSIRELPIPDLTALSYGNFAPAEWVLQLKRTTKSLAYAWIINIKNAMDVIEGLARKGSTSYMALKQSIDVVFAKLQSFVAANFIDGSVLIVSPIFHEFSSEVVSLRKPKNAGDSDTALQFKVFRERAIEISRSFMTLREIVVETLACVTEAIEQDKEKNLVNDAFVELPNVEEVDLPEVIEVDLENRLATKVRGASLTNISDSREKSVSSPLETLAGNLATSASTRNSAHHPTSIQTTLHPTYIAPHDADIDHTMSYEYDLDIVRSASEEAVEYRNQVVPAVLRFVNTENINQFVFFAAMLEETIDGEKRLLTPILFLGLASRFGVNVIDFARQLGNETGWAVYVFEHRFALECAGPYPVSLPTEKEAISRHGRRTITEEQLFHDSVYLGVSIGIFPPLVTGQKALHAKSHGISVRRRGTEDVFGISCGHGWRDSSFTDHNSLVGAMVHSPAYVDAKNSYDLLNDIHAISDFQLLSLKKDDENKPSKRSKSRLGREKSRNALLKNCKDTLYNIVEDRVSGQLARIGEIKINKVEFKPTSDPEIYKKVDYCLYTLDGVRAGVNSAVADQGMVTTWCAGDLQFDDNVVLHGRTVAGIKGKVCGVLAYCRTDSMHTIEIHCILATEASCAPANASENSGAVWISEASEETVGLHTSHCDIQIGNADMIHFSSPVSRMDAIAFVQSKCAGGKVFPCHQTTEYGELVPLTIRAGMALSFKEVLDDAEKEGYDLVHVDEE